MAHRPDPRWRSRWRGHAINFHISWQAFARSQRVDLARARAAAWTGETWTREPVLFSAEQFPVPWQRWLFLAPCDGNESSQRHQPRSRRAGSRSSARIMRGRAAHVRRAPCMAYGLRPLSAFLARAHSLNITLKSMGMPSCASSDSTRRSNIRRTS